MTSQGARIGQHVVADDELEGIVFDVDGTLLDTMPMFYNSWVETGSLPEFNLTISEYEFYSLAGKSLTDTEIITHLHVTQKGGPPSQEFVQNFLDAWSEPTNPAVIEFMVQLMKDYKEQGIPIAIATNSERATTIPMLRQAGIFDIVDENNIVFKADVQNPKPAPDVYLAAANKIGADPTKCRAYDDAEVGLQAAYSAGMEVIDPTYHPDYPAPEGLQLAKAEQVSRRYWL